MRAFLCSQQKRAAVCASDGRTNKCFVLGIWLLIPGISVPFIWDRVCKITGAPLINAAFNGLWPQLSHHTQIYMGHCSPPGAERRPFGVKLWWQLPQVTHRSHWLELQSQTVASLPCRPASCRGTRRRKLLVCVSPLLLCFPGKAHFSSILGVTLFFTRSLRTGSDDA